MRKYMIIGAFALLQAAGPMARSQTLPATQPSDAREDTPTLITLHVKNKPLKEVLEDLSRQAGINVRVPVFHPSAGRGRGRGAGPGLIPPTYPDVTLDVDKQPFWLVMRELCKQTSLVPERTESQEQITLKPSGHYAGPAFSDREIFSNQGCFLVTLVRVEAGQVWMQLYVDPRVHVLDCPHEEVFDKATDEQGKSLLRPPLSTTHTPDANEGGWFWNIYAPLQMDLKGSKKIAVLHGEMTLTVLQQSQRWEIKNPLAAKPETFNLPGTGINFTFEKLTGGDSGREYELNFVVKGRPGDKQSHPAFNFYAMTNGLHLLDDEGQYLNHYNCHDQGGDDLDNHFNFTFDTRNLQDTLAEPVKMVLDIPTKVRQVKVPVEFKDLALP